MIDACGTASSAARPSLARERRPRQPAASSAGAPGSPRVEARPVRMSERAACVEHPFPARPGGWSTAMPVVIQHGRAQSAERSSKQRAGGARGRRALPPVSTDSAPDAPHRPAQTARSGRAVIGATVAQGGPPSAIASATGTDGPARSAERPVLPAPGSTSTTWCPPRTGRTQERRTTTPTCSPSAWTATRSATGMEAGVTAASRPSSARSAVRRPERPTTSGTGRSASPMRLAGTRRTASAETLVSAPAARRSERPRADQERTKVALLHHRRGRTFSPSPRSS